jgi:hypothetical protein
VHLSHQGNLGPDIAPTSVGTTNSLEDKTMTKKRYGMLAGIAGAAFAAWWYSRRDAMARRMSQPSQGGSAHGEVIFRNSPVV